MMTNIHAAWIGFLLGCISGAIPGLFFHKEDWVGGYAGWPRRLIRLAHISFFGLGLLNLGYATTVRMLGFEEAIGTTSFLLLVGAVTMPLVCYLSAWKRIFRHLFFIPAMSVTVGIALFAWKVLDQ